VFQTETTIKRIIQFYIAWVFLITPVFSSALPMKFNTSTSYNRQNFSGSMQSPVMVISRKSVLRVVKSKARMPAAINRAALMVTSPSRIFYGENGTSLSPELIAEFNRVRAMEKPFDPSEIIPLDMHPTNNSSEIFSQVADRSMKTIMNSKTVRKSYLGQTATIVEKKMKQAVIIGASDDPEAVQHKLNFNHQAFQATAQVEYTGVTNAALKYKIDESKLALELFEKVATGQDLVVSHSISPSDNLSQVSYRWNF
jgi:hypothetical protein